MIITQKKPLEEVLALVGEAKTVAVIGCGLCASTCQTGGAPEVEAMKQTLEEAGKTVVITDVADACCMKLGVRAKCKAISTAAPDCIVCMSCGDGVQTIAKNCTGIPVYPANNTMFLGEVARVGIWEEACKMCGDCVLGTTGGICPITQCAKSLVNGPCGGQKNGKCDSSLCGGRKNREQFRKISPRKKSIGRDNVRRRRHRSSRRPYYSISCSNSVNRFDAKNS